MPRAKFTREYSNGRLRNFVFTLHLKDGESYEDAENRVRNGVDAAYVIMGREVCPTTGRKHLQGYVELDRKVSFNTLVSWVSGWYIDRRKGSKLVHLKFIRRRCNKITEIVYL